MYNEDEKISYILTADFESMDKVTLIFIGFIFFFIFTSGWVFVSVLFPKNLESETTPEDYGLSFESITLTTEDGVNLSGWFIPQEQTEQKKEAIILLHGYPADKGDILPSTAFLADTYDLLYIDFRSLGESSGSYSTLGIFEQKDLAAAVNFLKKRGYQHIGVWGFSVGGATALIHAPKNPDIDAVVSISAYARLSDLAKEAFQIPYLRSVLAQCLRGYAYLLWGTDINKVAPADAVRRYQKPVLVIHPSNDQVIPFSHGRTIKQALQTNTQAEFWFPEGHHGFVPPHIHQSRVTTFFDRHLRAQ